MAERSFLPNWILRFVARVADTIPQSDPVRTVIRGVDAELRVGKNTVRLLRKGRQEHSSREATQVADLNGAIRRGDRVLLSFDEDLTLRHAQSLPVSNLSAARNVLALELSRLLPFADATLLKFQWFYPRKEGGIVAHQAVLKPETISDARAFLVRQGAKLCAVGLRQHDGTQVPAFLTPGGDDYGTVVERPWRMTALLSALVFLGVCVGSWSYVAKKHQAILREHQIEIEALTTQARAVRSTIDETASRSELFAAMIQGRKEAAPVVSTWQELTQLLPDHSWVQQLSYNGEFFLLEGVSTNAESLVPLLETSGQFKDVSFTAPVTQSPAGQGQRFAIRFRTEMGP